MKTRLFISLLVVAMGVIVFSSCQKRSSCDGGIQGHLEVLDEPYQTGSEFDEKDFKIIAYFNDSDNHIYRITGKVPKKISSNSLVTAKMHIVYPDEEFLSKPHLMTIYEPVYKLDCICIDEK